VTKGAEVEETAGAVEVMGSAMGWDLLFGDVRSERFQLWHRVERAVKGAERAVEAPDLLRSEGRPALGDEGLLRWHGLAIKRPSR
jgi:hypothetical protein